MLKKTGLILIGMLAAIASNLAKGLDTPTAVRSACRYIEAAIRTAPGLGKGHGPLNHFHSTYTLPFAPYVQKALPSFVVLTR
jgi:hydroxymethylpyrimidine/phosphomethylpyrimidine kinase